MTTPLILHIDMDAFFASVEQLDNPALKGKCVIVGGPSMRGVVAAASYEARRYGIRSAMPIFQARQRCRDLVIVPPRRKRYAAVSSQVMAILNRFSPLVEPISIDEAYIDATGCRHLFGSARELAQAIKNLIRNEVRLTCTVGAAPNKFLAKIASDINKPDGMTIIEPHQVQGFIDKLHVEKVPGVGRRARSVLETIGVHHLGQVRDRPAQLVLRKLGKFGHRLIELAHGKDPSPVRPDSVSKSVSSETTLDCDTRDRSILESHLLIQSQSVARQLRRRRLRARTVTLKIKTIDFKSHTRCHTFQNPVRASETIFQAVSSLLDAFEMKMAVRLVGVGASGLKPEGMPVQASLFPEAEETRYKKWEEVDRAVDAVSDRFGGGAVVRGTLTHKNK